MKVRTLHDIEIDDIKQMIRSLQAGKKLPTVHCVDMGDYIKALEGTHRLLAYHIAGIEPVIEMVDYDGNKNTPILDIIGETDGDNDYTPDDTLDYALAKYDTVGEDLEF